MNYIKLQSKLLIKIPKTIDTIYCKKKNILIFNSFNKIKSLKVKTKILLIPYKNLLVVSNIYFNKNNKNSKVIQGTFISEIKQIIIELNYELYLKLNFIGVGYRAFSFDNFDNQFYFKLGYSHLIYFRIPNPLNSSCSKFTKIFLFGDLPLNKITQTAALIRECKKPEPYKGKGILYYGEKIKLKKGKKI